LTSIPNQDLESLTVNLRSLHGRNVRVSRGARDYLLENLLW
jgi:hypothetical protein